MQDNNSVTHGLHWLTLGEDGWECANPDCDWRISRIVWQTQTHAQHYFNRDHAKLSDPPASVPT